MSEAPLLVFSGGSAFNAMAGPLLKFTTCTTYVLPVTDDGGSTAEIRRVDSSLWLIVPLANEI